MLPAEISVKNKLAAVIELTFDKDGYLKKRVGASFAESLNITLIDESINAFNNTPSQKEKQTIAFQLRDYIYACRRKDRLKLYKLSFLQNLDRVFVSIGKNWLWLLPVICFSFAIFWPLPTTFLAITLLIIPSLLWFKQNFSYRLAEQKKLENIKKLAETIDSSYSPESIIQLSDITKNKKLFADSPAIPINIDELPRLSKDTLAKNLAIICEVDVGKKNPFLKHIGASSTYGQKNSLCVALQLVYYRLNGNLDTTLEPLPEKKMLISKLLEDVDACTAGFHNRVNTILESFQKPLSFDELLYQTRKNLVEKTAINLSDEVHAANRVTIIAKEEGLGVRPNFSGDISDGKIEDNRIRQALRSEFEANYTVFKLPFLLVEYLQGILYEVGYVGPKEAPHSYTTGSFDSETEKFTLLINRYLGTDNQNFDWTQFFIISEDSLILDINWEFIKQCFLNKLLKEEYFTLHKSKNYLVFATLYLSEFLKSILYSPEITEFDGTLQQKLLEKTKYGWNILMLAACHQPASLDVLLEFLTTQTSSACNETLQILLETNDQGWNALMIAARHHPASLNLLLEFMTKHILRFDKEALQALFLGNTDQGWNVLMLATKYHPESLKTLLDYLEKNPNTFSKNALLPSFLNKNNDESNIIMIAAKYYPELLKVLLNFLYKHPEQFDKETLNSLIIENNSTGWNSLKLAARYQPDSFNVLFDFVVQKMHLENNTLLDLLLEKTACGWNSWMLAARYQPEVAKKILAFTQIIPEISLEKNSLFWNSFVSTSQHQPEKAKALLQFMIEHNELFKIEISQRESLIQQNFQQGLLNLMAIQSPSLELMTTILQFISLYPELLAHAPKKLVVNLFNKLAWIDDKELIDKILAKNSNLLLEYFSKDYFIDNSKNLEHISKKLLITYSEELNTRQDQNITHTTRFFSLPCGYSTSKKIAAVEALHCNTKTVKSLKNISKTPGLKNGRLGRLFSAYKQIADNHPTDVTSTTNIQP
jgi:hypothetical protein